MVNKKNAPLASFDGGTSTISPHVLKPRFCKFCNSPSAKKNNVSKKTPKKKQKKAHPFYLLIIKHSIANQTRPTQQRANTRKRQPRQRPIHFLLFFFLCAWIFFFYNNAMATTTMPNGSARNGFTVLYDLSIYYLGDSKRQNCHWIMANILFITILTFFFNFRYKSGPKVLLRWTGRDWVLRVWLRTAFEAVKCRKRTMKRSTHCTLIWFVLSDTDCRDYVNNLGRGVSYMNTIERGKYYIEQYFLWYNTTTYNCGSVMQSLYFVLYMSIKHID